MFCRVDGAFPSTEEWLDFRVDKLRVVAPYGS
ncbi:hypothetical protein SAMN05216255_0900, partial [Pseudomonas segetis]